MKKLLSVCVAILVAVSVQAQEVRVQAARGVGGMGGGMGMMMGGFGGGGDWQARMQRENRQSKADLYQTQAKKYAKTFKLKKANKDLFTVMYLDWQTRRFNAVNPTGGDQESEETRTNYENLTNEEADQLVAQCLNRQVKQIAVDKECIEQFKTLLTPQQIAQIFLEQKTDMEAQSSQMRSMMNSFMGAGGFGGGFGGGFDGGFGGGMGGFGGF
ncbi:MAG: hypothetical protein MJY95_06305 [Bacteroidaceae bacterium]|nr:hypothetical protein [Bacteroidaceae bacterium]